MKTEYSLHKYMKVGIVHFMAFPEVINGEGPIEDTLEAIIQEDFFKVVEMTSIKDSRQRERVKKLVQAAGLQVCYGAQPVILSQKLDLNSCNAQERKKALDILEDCIDEASFLDAKNFALLSGKDPGQGLRRKAKDLLVDSLAALCRYAWDKSGMRILLETFDRDIDKRALIGPSKEAREITDRLRRSCLNFGVMLDLSHLPLQYESPQEAINNLGMYLAHAHIGNCVLKDKKHGLYGDTHPGFCIPEGENGIDELSLFLSELLRVGFLREDNPPILSMEVKPQPHQSSRSLISETIDILKQSWSKVAQLRAGRDR